jgi:hypothetical protein
MLRRHVRLGLVRAAQRLVQDNRQPMYGALELLFQLLQGRLVQRPVVLLADG